MIKYHCVYPQPGCDLAALPEQWRERAEEIVAKLRPDGPKYQGCCCGLGGHRHLVAGEVRYLQAAGFLVEEDAEFEEWELP